MQIFQKNKNSGEKLIEENRKLTQKIIADFGDDILHLDMLKDSSPEDENMFLKSLWSSEYRIRNAKSSSVFEYLDKPVFPKAGDLNDTQIPEILYKLIRLLNQNKIVLDEVDTLEKREVYRFITEDVFTYNISPDRLNLGPCEFAYLDYYPDWQQFIIDDMTNILNEIMHDREDPEIFLFSAKSFSGKNGLLNKKELHKKIEDFREAFDEIIIHEILVYNSGLSPENGFVEFAMSYSTTTPGAKEQKEVRGKGRFDYVKQHKDYWVQKMDIPGLDL